MNKFHLSYADWSGKEYLAALRCILGGKISAGDYVHQLIDNFRERYAPSTIYPLNYGRNAIHIALHIFRCRAPSRTEVVLPAYICPSVVETIVHAGLTPVFADISHDLNMDPDAMATAITVNTLAVIAPHMYGCPARIGLIEKLCQEAGVFLVDDAAQVVGVKHEGRPLGTFGDIGVISFAQSKAVVTGIRGSGGILLVNNPELDTQAKSIWSSLPKPSGRTGAFLDFLWNYVWSSHTGNTGYYFARIKEKLKSSHQSQVSMSRISNLEAAIALAQIERLNQIQQKRLQVIAAYHNALPALCPIGFPQYAPGRYLAKIMLLLPEKCNASKLISPLKKAGVDSRLAYPVADSTGRTSSIATGMSCRLIGVPCGIEINQIEANKICSILVSTLNSVLSK